ncbi:hypothetical protein EYF80_063182 [Liparis tanakae]
MSVTV